MKTCLITASTLTEVVTPGEVKESFVPESPEEPPLGLLSLAAVLEARGVSFELIFLDRIYVDFARATRNSCSRDFTEAAARELAALDSEVYGFGSLCSSYPLTVRIARRLKELLPKATILFGGPQASVVDLPTLAAFPFVDFILRGEAEFSLPIFLDEMRGKRQFHQVPGLTWRDGEQPRRNPAAPPIPDLDQLPTAAFHMFGDLRGAPSISLELGRGCPFACTFCSTNDFFRRSFRLRSPERVLQDMRILQRLYGVANFALIHDMFTVDRRKVAEFCEAMLASGEAFTWSCSARTDCVDEQLLELMARSGCRGIFYGVETGSQKMQKTIGKHLDIERAKEIITATERFGMESTVSLIVGFPEENWDDLRATLNMFVHSLRHPNSTPPLNLLAPLADTPIHVRHKNELTLDELCSRMSHPTSALEEETLELVRDYPEIFPNFYLLPAACLDRPGLIELREFLLIMVAQFRWLCVAIHDTTDGIADFFLQWREHRLELLPELAGPRLRNYYLSSQFSDDWLGFVGAHPQCQGEIITALLDCEHALRRSRGCPETMPQPAGELVSGESELEWRDVPARKPEVILFELPFDLQNVLGTLATRQPLVWNRTPHYYASREQELGMSRVIQISDWTTKLLRACDGRSNLEAIAEKLSREIPEMNGELRDYFLAGLVQKAHSGEFIELYRSPLEAETCDCQELVGATPARYARR